MPACRRRRRWWPLRLVLLLVKVGALAFILALPNDFAINLQLLGGIWILQTLPAILIGRYARFLHRWAVLAGWAVGMAYGTWTAYGVPAIGNPGSHFGGSSAVVSILGWQITETTIVCIGLTALVPNLLVAGVGTVLLRALKVPDGPDETVLEDYHADTDDPGVVTTPAQASGSEVTGR